MVVPVAILRAALIVHVPAPTAHILVPLVTLLDLLIVHVPTPELTEHADSDRETPPNLIDMPVLTVPDVVDEIDKVVLSTPPVPA